MPFDSAEFFRPLPPPKPTWRFRLVARIRAFRRTAPVSPLDPAVGGWRELSQIEVQKLRRAAKHVDEPRRG